MNVELPTSGCNIISSSTSFYNYSDDLRTRETYVIYEGVAKKQSESYNQYGYSYTGECLNTGDLVYKPELKVWFPIVSIIILFFICKLAFRLFRGRL